MVATRKAKDEERRREVQREQERQLQREGELKREGEQRARDAEQQRQLERKAQQDYQEAYQRALNGDTSALERLDAATASYIRQMLWTRETRRFLMELIRRALGGDPEA